MQFLVHRESVPEGGPRCVAVATSPGGVKGVAAVVAGSCERRGGGGALHAAHQSAGAALAAAERQTAVLQVARRLKGGRERGR